MVDIKQTQFNKVFLTDLNKQTLIVSPAGDAIGFRDSDVNKEMHTLLELIGQSEVSHLIIDLGNSEYFGSVIIGAINSLGLKTREQGGRVALCNASDDMIGILRAMKLDDIWAHYDSRKAALKAINA